MAHNEPFNPYASWLGQPPGKSRPNYFQLLRVRPRLPAEAQYRQAAEAGYQRCRSLLDRVPPSDHPEWQRRLREELDLARETLLDPDQRAAYLANLSRPPEKAASATPATPAAAPAAAPAKAPPVAIPIATPIASASVAVAAKDEDLDIPVLVATRHKKSPWRGLPLKLAIAGLLVIALGAIGWLVFMKGGLSGSGSEVVQQETASPALDPTRSEDTDPDAVPEQAPPNLAPDRANPDLATTPETETIEASTLEDPRQIALPESTGPAVEATELPLSDSEMQPALVALTPNQVQRLERDLRLTRLCMQRRQFDDAQQHLARVTKFVDSVTDPKRLLREEDAWVTQRVATLRDALPILEAFWIRVAASCQSIVGNPQLEIAGQFVGFVEADASSVTLRIAGVNTRYDYPYLPGGLAVELVRRTDIPDSGNWARELAAMYIISRKADVDYESKISEQLELAAEAGLDTQALAEFAALPLDAPSSRPEAVAWEPEPIHPSVAAIRTSHDYQRPDQLPAAAAQDAIESVLNAEIASPAAHAALMNEWALLCLSSQDPTGLEDAVHELGRIVEIDLPNRLASDLLALAKQPLDPETTRSLVERGIALLETTRSNEKRPGDWQRLATRLLRLTRQNEWPDAERRLAQFNQ